MSHIVSEDFHSEMLSKDIIKKLKSQLWIKNVLLLSHNEMHICKDMNIMLNEHKKGRKVDFVLQPYCKNIIVKIYDFLIGQIKTHFEKYTIIISDLKKIILIIKEMLIMDALHNFAIEE